MPKLPFETAFDEILRAPDLFVDAVFSSLESEFLVLPKGAGFVGYPLFERGYESLKIATEGFSNLDSEKVFNTIITEPIAMIVLRSMLGFTPPEWGYVATQKTGVSVTQGFIRSIDRKVRMAPEVPLYHRGEVGKRLKAMVDVACMLLEQGAPETSGDQLHRLDKADTKLGSGSIQNLSRLGAPYAMLLYERFLGRPFAGHRDSVSELIGDILESAIENVLEREAVSYRKTRRAERIEGFDQTPDFIIPSEFNPQVIIEAKITEDDGTARDKVTRIQHLGELSLEGRTKDNPRFEVIACIGGRGFGVRREDMKKMILATRGKVFTLKTMDRLVECTRLREYRAKR